MGLRCYYKKGGKEIINGVSFECGVFDEANEDELKKEGWSRTPETEEIGEAVDEILQTLRDAAKERSIKGWQRMGEDKLRQALGLTE